jgi:hypothetical protein
MQPLLTTTMIDKWLHRRRINLNADAAQAIPPRELFAWLATYTH